MRSTPYVFIYSPEIAAYRYPTDCPFKTERGSLCRNILLSSGSPFFYEESPRNAGETELLTFHTIEYIRMLQRISGGDLRPEDLFCGVGTAETPVFPDLFSYAVMAAGGSIRAAELLLKEQAFRCFNPWGGFHHAFSDRAGGFCYINDVVLACIFLRNAGKRVFCLDLDAHHGNGTQSAFYDDPSVFTVSFHESGKTLYPWSGFEDEIGEGKGKGYNVNVPLPAGTDDDSFIHVFRQVVPPLINAFQPDFIVLEIGMDILSVDPLTHLNMTNNAIADTIPIIRDISVPVLMLGGGGYNPEATARGWALAWQVLCDAEKEADLTVGMGGVFLGNAEVGSLRDMRSYMSGAEKLSINEELKKTTDYICEKVFPIHGIKA